MRRSRAECYLPMFNIINGNIVFPFNVHRPHSRTNYLYFSYVPSVITVWNTLPVGIRSSSSVSVFKHNLLHLAHVAYSYLHVASYLCNVLRISLV